MDKIIEQQIHKEFKKQFEEVKKNKEDHITIISPDSDLLQVIIDYIKNNILKKSKVIEVSNNLMSYKSDVVYFLSLDNDKDKELQMLCYYYLDRCTNGSFFMYTSRSNCFELMEKRVVSRCNSKYVFFPYIANKGRTEILKKISGKQYGNIKPYDFVSHSLSNLKKYYYEVTYELDGFTMKEYYTSMSNTQILILLISSKSKISFENIFRKSKEFFLGIPELGNIEHDEILNAYYFCLNTGLLYCKMFHGDKTELLEHIKEKRPLYFSILFDKIFKK